ncbi:protein-disulfide reductase DsbD [Sulfurimonas sp. HSL-3221]|uniref:protein-disulfide reductase DsbD n=1 Tax=Sulfurimonadaceae TaxID=2771471 RepID=UPI001E2E700A|nr:protein-disulfide reductase DsbD [Sulfurimonas sp. HSL-3221]UFS61450.1 protein-disulfide reductase DsbD [Sulfurimonas sp. HSL-3221]
MKRFLAFFTLLSATLLFAFQSSFLMPEEAFKPKASLLDNQHIAIDIELGEGIYVYADKLDAKVKAPSGVSISEVKVNSVAEEHDGDMVHLHNVPVEIILTSSQKTGIVPVTVALAFQGCSERGLCYEPQNKEYTFDVDLAKLGSAAAEAPEKPKAPAAAQGESETDIIVDTLKGGSLWAILALFFGFGLALSLTPCIFPMIPILSSIIVSQGERLTARRGFTLSLVYVLAMAFAYTIAGIMAGLFGENLQVILQNPWAIGAFALIFVALAFSMFGFYEIGLPATLQTRLSRFSDKAGEKGGFTGVAVMGFLSALIVGPCVAPGLAAALIYIGQTGNAALGGVALFVMSLGMGVPLLLIGLGAGRFMPKPGGWMNIVTEVFGAVMIGVAIWMVSRVIPDWITMMLWAIYFIVAAVYLGAFEPIHGGVRRSMHSFIKAIGIVFMLYGTILLVGALSGGTSMTHPLKGFEVKMCTQDTAAAPVAATEVAFEVIHSEAELEQVIAANKGKKVMLDFSATWCAACQEYAEITFADPRVVAALQDFVLVQADVTENSDPERALTKNFGLYGPPGILFFDETGKLMKEKTLIGYKPPEAFLEHLRSL